jgi:nucleoside phosphorylase
MIKDFSSSHKVVEAFDSKVEESVINAIKEFWNCYKSIKEISINEFEEVIENKELFFKDGFSLITEYVAKNKTVCKINLKDLPDRIIELIHRNIEIDQKHEFTVFLERMIVTRDPDILFHCEILQIMFLLVVYDIIDNQWCNDIDHLLNKCIVLDHIGFYGYDESELISLLDLLNNRVEKNIDSLNSETLWAIGSLNYRLNKYNQSITYFKKYINLYRILNKTIDQGTSDRLFKAHIFLGYCHEKLYTKPNLAEAINIYETIRLEKNQLVDFKSSSDNLQVEIYHGLGHFYNEMAIYFLDPMQNIEEYAQCISKARNYMTIAVKFDPAFYSCYGSIFYEHSDFFTAYEIYQDAERIDSIIRSQVLSNEIMFYKAQAELATGNKERATDLIVNFREYLNKIHINDSDATAHAIIFCTKIELLDCNIHSKNFNPFYFKELLSKIYDARLSNYSAQTIRDEQQKIIFALNVFFYLARIILDLDSFSYLIGEIINNLNLYLEVEKKYGKKHKPCSLENKESKTSIKEGFFSLLIDETEILGYGIFDDINNNKQLNSAFKITYLYSIDNFNEFNEYYKQHDRHHVVFVNASTILNDENKKILKKIIDDKTCIVTTVNNKQFLFDSYDTPGTNDDINVYKIDDIEELLKITFCLRVYEMLRSHLILPIPLLGLAPISSSRSYFFQNGELVDLIIPESKKSNFENFSKIKDFKEAVGIVESEFLKQWEKIIKNEVSINFLKTCITNIQSTNVCFVCYFPRQDINNLFDNKIIYSIRNKIFKNDYSLILPAEINKVYTLRPYKKYINEYTECKKLIEDNKGNICQRNCHSVRNCKTFLAQFYKHGTKEIGTILQLLTIFNIEKKETDYDCLCINVQNNNQTNREGILFEFIRNTNRKININIYHECESINNFLNRDILEKEGGIVVKNRDASHQTINNIKYINLPDEELIRIKNTAKILIVVANEIEKKSLEEIVETLPQLNNIGEEKIIYKKLFGNNTYFVARIGSYAAIYVKCEMGATQVNGSQQTVNEAIKFWESRVVIGAGIAMGLNKAKLNKTNMLEDMKIGDVLLSRSIIEYERQKISNNESLDRGDKPRSGHNVFNRFENQDDWTFITKDNRQSKIYTGIILSGEKLIDDKDLVDKIKDQYKEAIGYEMESQGIYTACMWNEVQQWIIVKGVSDWGFDRDIKSKEEDHIFAARASMSLIKHTLSNNETFKELGIPCLLVVN